MDELKEWALEQFGRYLTKEAFYSWLKILIPIIMIFVGSCIAYALVNNSNMSAAQTTIKQHTDAISSLNTEINRKLDVLIERNNTQQKINKIREPRE